jgi:hypothetical protein
MMNFDRPRIEFKCAGMNEKYRQVFIDAQKRVLEEQMRKVGLVLTPDDSEFLKSVGIKPDSECQ